MKRILSFLLIAGMVLCLFTACGEAPESPTDVKDASSVVSVAEKQEGVSSVVSQPIKEQEPQNNQEEKEDVSSSQPAESKIPVSSVPSETPNNSVSSQPVSQNTEGVVPLIHVEYPTFTQEGALKNWILGNHPDYFADGQKDTVASLQNQGSTIYYRPSIPVNHSLFTLSRVKVHTPSRSFDYFYNEVGEDAELAVFVAHDTVPGFGNDGIYDVCKNIYENPSSAENAEEVGFLFQHHNTDFYVAYTPADGSCFIAWKQFGFSHVAALHGHFDQIEEIIPLLYLQQVKVDSSAVVQ